MSVATIGSALAERRRELGLEKGQAADKIGMSRTTYSSYEQDAQRPSVDVFPALAEFLSVSMEELLALYGATCVAAIRPSLERLLSDRGGDRNYELDTNDSASRPNEFKPEALRAFTEAPLAPGAEIGSNEAVLEDDEISVESDVPDEVSHVAHAELVEVTAVLEPPDVQIQSGSKDLGTFSPPESEGREEGIGSFTTDVYGGPPARLDPVPQSGESQEIESMVFEPSPYFISTSLTDGAEKSSDFKKKKKQKKKNKSKSK